MSPVNGTSQVRIQLQTKSPELQLPQEIGPILVRTGFKRLQLSQLVNSLLENEESHIPLQFLINGQYLKTTIDDFLTQNGISAETTLAVEYVKALIPPQTIASYEHDDWVSSVDVLSGSSQAARWSSQSPQQSRILSGSFDGLIRVWGMSSDLLATGTGHSSAVKSAKFISPTQVVSSSGDRTLRLWKYEDADVGSASLTPTLELYGHSASVDSVAVHAPSSRILSASADHTVGIWSTRKSDAPAAQEELIPVSNKRRKITPTAKPTATRGPLSLMSGHASQVAEVCFDETDASVAYSVSWDHTLKTWDLATSKCIDTRTTPQSLWSVCHLPEKSLVAAGTALKHITLIDPRVSAQTVSAMTLRGHTNAIVSMARDPNSSHQLLSGSYDGTCRIWDLRSVRNDASERIGESVFIIERDAVRQAKKLGTRREDIGGVKVFGVAWDAEVGMVSGAEDKKVQIDRQT
ncbi:ribosome biogenesis protein ytm1 [Oleoguttula sp. CCFEE 5521]